MGMMYTDIKHDYVTSYTEFFRSVDRDKFTSIFQEMRSEGEKLLRSEGIPDDRMEMLYSCDVRYDGQHHEVEVEITREEIDAFNLEPMRERFHEKHMEIYAFNLKEVGNECELVSLRLTAVGKMEKPTMIRGYHLGEDSSKAIKSTRRVFLMTKKAYGEVSVYDAMKLGYGNKVEGPAIIEHPTTSIVVPSEYNVVYDEVGAAIMYLKSEEKKFKKECVIR
jgi:N-methylhydantoinase A